MASKVEARRLVSGIGVPILAEVTDRYPLIIKASAGGGGRGMRIVRTPQELPAALEQARAEAESAFGDGTVFTEPYLESAHHIEVQILADTHGTVWALGERECSLQRRHQKVIEETPSPAVDDDLRRRLSEAAITAAKAVDYVGAGTVEFLLDPAGDFWFLEMNTRLQVEHPVTEEVTGLDLVALQLAIAAGERVAPYLELETTVPFGHAIEARLTAEDPAAGYRPSTGTFHRFEIDTWPKRVDTGIEDGSAVSPFYDSMVAKVIAHGRTRQEAIRLLVAALRSAELHGPVTNRDQLVRILEQPAFVDGHLHTGFLDEFPCTDPIHGDVAMAAAAVALAEQAANRANARVLAGIPSGWRNNAAVDQTIELALEEVPVRVSYRLGRDGHVTVDGTLLEATVVSAASDEVVFDIDGLRRTYRVARYDDQRFVDADDGHVAFTVLPRHPDPERMVHAGSLTAPMPGNVLRVLVAVGDTVTAGQPLVVVEAMKMEHEVRAPGDGTVAGIDVAPGDQVDTGQVLLQLEEAWT